MQNNSIQTSDTINTDHKNSIANTKNVSDNDNDIVQSQKLIEEKLKDLECGQKLRCKAFDELAKILLSFENCEDFDECLSRFIPKIIIQIRDRRSSVVKHIIDSFVDVIRKRREQIRSDRIAVLFKPLFSLLKITVKIIASSADYCCEEIVSSIKDDTKDNIILKKLIEACYSIRNSSVRALCVKYIRIQIESSLKFQLRSKDEKLESSNQNNEKFENSENENTNEEYFQKRLEVITKLLNKTVCDANEKVRTESLHCLNTLSKHPIVQWQQGFEKIFSAMNERMKNRYMKEFVHNKNTSKIDIGNNNKNKKSLSNQSSKSSNLTSYMKKRKLGFAEIKEEVKIDDETRNKQKKHIENVSKTKRKRQFAKFKRRSLEDRIEICLSSKQQQDQKQENEDTQNLKNENEIGLDIDKKDKIVKEKIIKEKEDCIKDKNSNIVKNQEVQNGNKNIESDMNNLLMNSKNEIMTNHDEHFPKSLNNDIRSISIYNKEGYNDRLKSHSDKSLNTMKKQSIAHFLDLQNLVLRPKMLDFLLEPDACDTLLKFLSRPKTDDILTKLEKQCKENTSNDFFGNEMHTSFSDSDFCAQRVSKGQNSHSNNAINNLSTDIDNDRSKKLADLLCSTSSCMESNATQETDIGFKPLAHTSLFNENQTENNSMQSFQPHSQNNLSGKSSAILKFIDKKFEQIVKHLLICWMSQYSQANIQHASQVFEHFIKNYSERLLTLLLNDCLCLKLFKNMILFGLLLGNTDELLLQILTLKTQQHFESPLLSKNNFFNNTQTLSNQNNDKPAYKDGNFENKIKEDNLMNLRTKMFTKLREQNFIEQIVDRVCSINVNNEISSYFATFLDKFFGKMSLIDNSIILIENSIEYVSNCLIETICSIKFPDYSENVVELKKGNINKSDKNENTKGPSLWQRIYCIRLLASIQKSLFKREIAHDIFGTNESAQSLNSTGKPSASNFLSSIVGMLQTGSSVTYKINQFQPEFKSLFDVLSKQFSILCDVQMGLDSKSNKIKQNLSKTKLKSTSTNFQTNTPTFSLFKSELFGLILLICSPFNSNFDIGVICDESQITGNNNPSMRPRCIKYRSPFIDRLTTQFQNCLFDQVFEYRHNNIFAVTFKKIFDLYINDDDNNLSNKVQHSQQHKTFAENSDSNKNQLSNSPDYNKSKNTISLDKARHQKFFVCKTNFLVRLFNLYIETIDSEIRDRHALHSIAINIGLDLRCILLASDASFDTEISQPTINSDIEEIYILINEIRSKLELNQSQNKFLPVLEKEHKRQHDDSFPVPKTDNVFSNISESLMWSFASNSFGSTDSSSTENGANSDLPKSLDIKQSTEELNVNLNPLLRNKTDKDSDINNNDFDEDGDSNMVDIDKTNDCVSLA